MTRLLTMHRTTVPAGERKQYLERLMLNKAHYSGARCRFWVFEESALPGAFVEFAESDSEASLIDAHATAPNRVSELARIYHETEIG